MPCWLSSAPAAGATALAEPVALTACGLPRPLLVTATLAERTPAADGLNRIPNWHEAPGCSTAPLQLSDTTVNSAAFVLLTPLIVTVLPPVLVAPSIIGALCAPTCVAGRVIEAGID